MNLNSGNRLVIDNKATAGQDPEPPEGEAPPVYLAFNRPTGQVLAFVRGAPCDDCDGPCMWSKAHMYDYTLKSEWDTGRVCGLEPASLTSLAATAATQFENARHSALVGHPGR